MPEQRIIKCPFCSRGDISTTHTPKTMVQRYSHASSNKKLMTYYKDEKYTVLTDCSKCSKSKKEIEKRLKEGESTSISDAAKRAKESGLPLRF